MSTELRAEIPPAEGTKPTERPSPEGSQQSLESWEWKVPKAFFVSGLPRDAGGLKWTRSDILCFDLFGSSQRAKEVSERVVDWAANKGTEAAWCRKWALLLGGGNPDEAEAADVGLMWDLLPDGLQLILFAGTVALGQSLSGPAKSRASSAAQRCQEAVGHMKTPFQLGVLLTVAAVSLIFSKFEVRLSPDKVGEPIWQHFQFICGFCRHSARSVLSGCKVNNEQVEKYLSFAVWSCRRRFKQPATTK